MRSAKIRIYESWREIFFKALGVHLSRSLGVELLYRLKIETNLRLGVCIVYPWIARVSEYNLHAIFLDCV